MGIFTDHLYCLAGCHSESVVYINTAHISSLSCSAQTFVKNRINKFILPNKNAQTVNISVISVGGEGSHWQHKSSLLYIS